MILILGKLMKMIQIWLQRRESCPLSIVSFQTERNSFDVAIYKFGAQEIVWERLTHNNSPRSFLSIVSELHDFN